METGAPNRDIPESIKRQLRREAGFGCCICGNPVFEYHHIKDWALTKSHNPLDMMVVCPNHHNEATLRALTEPEQRRWKERPLNIANGYVDGLLKITEPGVAVQVGTNYLVGPGFKFTVDGAPLLSLDRDSDGRLQLSLDLYDAADSLLLTIHNNEWITGDPMPWDVEFSHRKFVLRRKRGEVTLSINARRAPILLHGQLWRKGQLFEMNNRVLRFNGVVREVNVSEIGFVGSSFSADTTSGLFQIVPDPRFGAAMQVSEADRLLRLEMCFAALRDLEQKAV
jgi:hypothetical protein